MKFFEKLKQDYGNVGLQVRKCRVDSGFWWNMYILVHVCMCKRGWLLQHNHSYDATQYQTHVGTSLPILLGCHQLLDGLISIFVYMYILPTLHPYSCDVKLTRHWGVKQVCVQYCWNTVFHKYFKYLLLLCKILFINVIIY